MLKSVGEWLAAHNIDIRGNCLAFVTTLTNGAPVEGADPRAVGGYMLDAPHRAPLVGGGRWDAGRCHLPETPALPLPWRRGVWARGLKSKRGW